MKRSRYNPLKSKKVARGTGWVLLIVGALLTSWAWFNLRDAQASRTWPTVTGRVLSTEVDRSVSSRNSQKRTYRYRPVVRFLYSVDGTAYTGDRISFRNDFYDQAKEARAIASRYPAAGDVEVYYRPNDPQVAVLEHGVDASTYLPFISVLFLVVGAMVVKGSRLADTKEEPFTPR